MVKMRIPRDERESVMERLRRDPCIVLRDGAACYAALVSGRKEGRVVIVDPFATGFNGAEHFFHVFSRQVDVPSMR